VTIVKAPVAVAVTASKVDAATPLRVRDALVEWFVEEALPQIKKGMRYTSGTVKDEDARRLARVRAHGFFQRLPSSFDHPTFADLRQVKNRMDVYLHGRARHFPYSVLLG
jgi:hypothetical protein